MAYAPRITASSIPVGKAIYVDAVNGNDSTGLAHRADKPFLTLLAAKAAAVSGDTIIVLPGAYNENDLVKNGVNWYFTSGAVVTYTGSSPNGIWDDYAGAATTKIDGFGVFNFNTTASAMNNYGGTIALHNSTSVFEIKCASVTSTLVGTTQIGGGGFQVNGAVVQQNGTLHLTADSILDNSTYNSVDYAAVWWELGECHIKANTVKSNTYPLYVDSGAPAGAQQAFWFDCHYLAGQQIIINGNASSQVWLNIVEIDCTSANYGGNVITFQGPKVYLTAQKVTGAVASGGHLLDLEALSWVTIQKLTVATGAVTGGRALRMNAAVARIEQIEDTSSACDYLVKFDAGTPNDLTCQKMIVTNTSGSAINVNTSTGSYLRNCVVDSSASTTGFPIVFGNTKYLTLIGCKLISNGSQTVTSGTAASTLALVTPVIRNNAFGSNKIVVAYAGATDGSSAVAGDVGELITSSIATGSSVSLTTATAANVTSVSLTKGDWDVQGNVNFTETTSTVTARTAGISTTSATIPTDGTEGYCGVQSTVTSEMNTITLPRKQVNVTSTTTVYLVGSATFSAGTCAGFGSITARRVR